MLYSKVHLCYGKLELKLRSEPDDETLIPESRHFAKPSCKMQWCCSIGVTKAGLWPCIFCRSIRDMMPGVKKFFATSCTIELLKFIVRTKVHQGITLICENYFLMEGY
jgi:hypothetical protein